MTKPIIIGGATVLVVAGAGLAVYLIYKKHKETTGGSSGSAGAANSQLPGGSSPSAKAKVVPGVNPGDTVSLNEYKARWDYAASQGYEVFLAFGKVVFTNTAGAKYRYNYVFKTSDGSFVRSEANVKLGDVGEVKEPRQK